MRCRCCGFLYQKPRVADDHLADCYPDHYPRHQEPSPRIPFKGSPGSVNRGWPALAGLTERRPVYGVLKLSLDVVLPLARLAKRGEVIRVGIRLE